MIKLVLQRHGQSVYNAEGKFCGWHDADLTEKGIEEAKESGEVLKKEGFEFDLAFTSVLIRANRTLNLTLKAMNHPEIPIKKSWRLNERMYGALQDHNKAETKEKVGEKQFMAWRRGYATPPPPVTKDDPRYPGNDPLYKDLDENDLPLTECLKDTVERVVPYWKNEIIPELKAGKRVLISAHGNSLRALVKYLDNVSDDEITGLNIPTGIPLVYELDDNLKPIRHYYLGAPEKVKAATEAVKNQGQKK